MHNSTGPGVPQSTAEVTMVVLTICLENRNNYELEITAQTPEGEVTARHLIYTPGQEKIDIMVDFFDMEYNVVTYYYLREVKDLGIRTETVTDTMSEKGGTEKTVPAMYVFYRQNYVMDLRGFLDIVPMA